MSRLDNQVFDFSNYTTIVKIHNGKVYLICELFQVISHDVNVQKAYNILNGKRQHIANNFAKDDIDIAKLQLKNKKFTNNANENTFTFDYVLKILIIVAVIAIPVVLFSLAINISYAYKNFAFSKMGEILLEPRQISQAVANAVNTMEKIDDKDKKELQQSFGRITRVIEPITSELKPLWEDTAIKAPSIHGVGTKDNKYSARIIMAKRPK